MRDSMRYQCKLVYISNSFFFGEGGGMISLTHNKLQAELNSGSAFNKTDNHYALNDYIQSNRDMSNRHFVA